MFVVENMNGAKADTTLSRYMNYRRRKWWMMNTILPAIDVRQIKLVAPELEEQVNQRVVGAAVGGTSSSVFSVIGKDFRRGRGSAGR